MDNEITQPFKLKPYTDFDLSVFADYADFLKPGFPILKSLYVGGSLRNPGIPEFAKKISELGITAFADWFQPGPNADDHWREYAKARGWTYQEALASDGADQIFDFDKEHLDATDGMVLLAPAGKSAHLELGYTIGRGKPGYIVFDGEPERWDVMVKFATKIFFSQEEFFNYLKEISKWLSKT